MKASCRLYDRKDDDTANQIAPVEDCLYSLRKRIDIAMVVCDSVDKDKLLATILEDIFDSAQMILDNFCVVKK